MIVILLYWSCWIIFLLGTINSVVSKMAAQGWVVICQLTVHALNSDIIQKAAGISTWELPSPTIASYWWLPKSFGSECLAQWQLDSMRGQKYDWFNFIISVIMDHAEFLECANLQSQLCFSWLLLFHRVFINVQRKWQLPEAMCDLHSSYLTCKT